MCNRMKIRILVRWPRVGAMDSLRTVCNVFKQIPCRITGHDEEFDLRQGDSHSNARAADGNLPDGHSRESTIERLANG